MGSAPRHVLPLGEKIDGVREQWTVEHLRALGLGGEGVDWNCAPAHEHCRRGKDKDDVGRIAQGQAAEGEPYRHQEAPASARYRDTKASGLRKRMDGTVERRISLRPAGRNTEGD